MLAFNTLNKKNTQIHFRGGNLKLINTKWLQIWQIKTAVKEKTSFLYFANF